MATRAPKAGTDKKSYICLNDYLRITLGQDGSSIFIAKNANDPPTVSQYTKFLWYNTDATYTIPAGTVTGNNEYGAGDNITYYLGELIFEDGAAQTFAWNAGNFPAQSDGAWYLHCRGGIDTDQTTIGKGEYGASKTETPTWDDQKGGWYSAAGYRVLARYISTTGVVSAVMKYGTRTQAKGYIETKGLEASTTSIIVHKLSCDIDGKIIEYVEDVTATNAGIGASTWYAVCVSELTGAISIKAVSTFDTWSGTMSGNQLDCYTYYDEDKKYMRDVDGANGYFRIIGVAKSNAAANGYDYVIPILKIPYSWIECESNAGATLNNNALTVINYEDILIDLNSEVTIGAAWKVTSKINQTFIGCSAFGLVSTAGWALAEKAEIQIFKNNALTVRSAQWVCQVAAGITVIAQIFGNIAVNCAVSDYFDTRGYQNNGGNIAYSANTYDMYIKVKGIPN